MKQLSVQELAAQAVDAPAAMQLLDVREPWGCALAPLKLPGVATLAIPMGSVPARLDELPRTQSVVCICHHGARSAQIVAFLMQRGWTDVYNLAGGIDAWSTQIDPSVPPY
jgi:rhodanese-related sulfurtransferase